MAKKTTQMTNTVEVNGKTFFIVDVASTERKVNRKTITVELFLQKSEKGYYRRDILIQRQEGQWTNKKKSQFIVSILKNNPTGVLSVTNSRKNPQLYMKSATIDGAQRGSTIYGFYNNKFALSKDTEPIRFTCESDDGERIETVVDLAGKKFSQLPPSVQEIFLDYELSLHEYVGFTDAELDEMVYNINNGTPFKANQKLRLAYGTPVMKYIQPICDAPLWDNVKGCNAKNDSILGTITRAMMLMDGYEEDFSAGNMNTYAEDFEISDNEYMIKGIGKLVDRLNDIVNNPKFSDEDMEFFNACNIPHLISALDEWTGTDEQFVDYLVDFLHSDARVEYDRHAATKSGSGAKQYSYESVTSRQGVLCNAMTDYIADNNIEGVEPSEETETVDNADDMRDSRNCYEYGTSCESEEQEQLLLESCKVVECGESEERSGYRECSDDIQSLDNASE